MLKFNFDNKILAMIVLILFLIVDGLGAVVAPILLIYSFPDIYGFLLAVSWFIIWTQHVKIGFSIVETKED